MVPLGAVLTVRERAGPLIISRYNMYPAAAIVGNTRTGISSGEGIIEMERLANQTLPKGMGYEWTEINYIQVDAAKNLWNNLIFPLAVAFVFLVLAAQYESWALPLAVILVVPMCILGSLTGAAVTHWDWLAKQFGVPASHSDINIFTQIGFVVLVGLASKNAILIVEFAKHLRESGLSRRDATLEAVKLRLRPILMTSFAFILGVVPLMLAVGAGAEMRRALGLAVFSGMLGVTMFGIFLTPVFFHVIEGIAETPLFASERMHRFGRVGLAVVQVLLWPLWLVKLVGLLFPRRRAASPTAMSMATDPASPPNGHGPPRVVMVDEDGQEADGRPPAPRAVGDAAQSRSESPTVTRLDDDPDRLLSK
jgi:multidrug efflux pump